MADELDYDELVRSYRAGLREQLRGFSAGLDSFVPDPDPLRGVTSLLEACAVARRSRVRIRLGAVTRQSASDEEWLALAQAFGDAQVVSLDDALIMEVALVGRSPGVRARAVHKGARDAVAASVARLGEAPAQWLPEVYRERARTGAARARHRQPPPATCVVVRRARGALWLELDDERRVERAGYFDVEDELLAGAYDELCAVAPGVPLVELVEHGVARIEQRLASAPPVAGVVLAERIAGVFLEIMEALQSLPAPSKEPSFWHPALSDQLTVTERLARVRDIVASVVDASELTADQLEVRGFVDETRLLVAFAPEVGAALRRTALMAIEHALQDRLDPALTVEREARADLNAIRRL